ncbi:hypothetical protein PR202_ga26228 [Eleusine coracana subsp. coracana]|uniref:Uncharacterized protein n=1 Tax=Eleusine coracana subsp. coracana TaxID=191504 RepID=A0AAV5DDK4_ELECO|nr:hypothetical protein QOZ80_3AG0242630 [Eleusine coracana subsp. coracana]GJN08321.1 hypothetical protein PR202_ga26228 [Eleusine coracana subsp. coracana]
MPVPGRSWLADLRSRLGAGAAKEDGLGILAFEAAAAMSRLVSLHVALSDAEVRRLRGDALRAEGVARLTSADQAHLLRLACAELLADLGRAADAAARIGARCNTSSTTLLLREFDRVYADAKRGSRLAHLDATFGFSRGASKRFRKMERHVAATARLYAEMDALGELEASERRMEQWMRHSGPMVIPAQAAAAAGKTRPAEPGEKLLRELKAQRHKVRKLMDGGGGGGSLWSVPASKAARLMAKSVLAVLARISAAFGAVVPGLPTVTTTTATGRGPWAAALGNSSGPLHRGAAAVPPDAAIRHSAPIFRQNDTSPPLESVIIKPSASTVGGAGMELRYAKVILSAETLLAALRPTPAGGENNSSEVPVGIDLSRRDGLYKMLPVSIREAVNVRLRERWRGQQQTPVVDEAAAAASRESVERVLRWLGPMAHDTVRWHDERSMERAHRFSVRPRALMVQTLHFADRRKADDAIVEVLLGLSCVCWYDDERRRLESLDWDDE